MRIQYCAATDKYHRSLDGSIDDSACVEGWQKCVESYQDIFRKVENDWNMVRTYSVCQEALFSEGVLQMGVGMLGTTKELLCCIVDESK